ncbi:TetR/AcrR family transcriptional regulator [Acetivibrio cellulolyticus]|uniref:TetR/AcrR family transcriptional regulator n=1 Tax=Acetivibrio cellulolyticus TaxID=35830 RepID=UPI0001E2FB6C|nr:TetR/AcrR family transcriptional regulator [Acetivibrio cellulolyticus]
MPKTLPNIKQDILITTRKLLAESGYEKLNIRNIASRCGIATGTLYNYYKSKHEIIEEILDNEWKVMFRCVEQGIKDQVSLIGKLGIIYTELCIFMNDVHNILLDSFSFMFNIDEFSKIKCHRNIFTEELLEKIFLLIQEGNEDKNSKLLADVICKLFVSYSYQGNVEFKTLEPVILSILKSE